MPTFSRQSMHQLSTCERHLQELFLEVIQTYDCTVIQGYRSPEEQIRKFNEGRSKIKHSLHNRSPAEAVDVGPYVQGRGIPWPKAGSDTYIKDLAQFYHFAGYVLALAQKRGLDIRWGGDWDRDHNLADQTFDDLVHFELRGNRL